MSLDSAPQPAPLLERSPRPAPRPRQAPLVVVGREVQLVVNARASGAAGADEVVARATSALRDADARVR